MTHQDRRGGLKFHSFKRGEGRIPQSETTWMTPMAETPIIAVDRLPLSYEELKPYLSTGVRLHIEVSPRGNSLKEAILLRLPPGISLRELDVLNYVIQALGSQAPRLIPWVAESPALMRLAAYLRRFKSSSLGTLHTYTTLLRRFLDWSGLTADELVAICHTAENLPDPKGLRRVKKLMEEYVGELRARGLAPSTIRVYIHAIRTLLKVNEVDPPKVLLPKAVVVYEDRAPRPEELWRMLQVADLRGRVIVSMLALGGFRIGTLCRLRYRHVREDLERGVIPVHIHVEADITKGKYASYDTFIGVEAVEYLRLYLEARRRGTEKIPPEDIDDESPLIRADRLREPRPITRSQMTKIIRDLYLKAGLAREKRGRRYVLRPHSIRKFFRTQLAAKGVPADYIEYMMGHKISTYHDIKMKGIEFLRNIYTQADLRITPREKADIYDFIEDILRNRGYTVNRELLRRAIHAKEPHRTVIWGEEERRSLIREAFPEMLHREILDPALMEPQRENNIY